MIIQQLIIIAIIQAINLAILLTVNFDLFLPFAILSAILIGWQFVVYFLTRK